MVPNWYINNVLNPQNTPILGSIIDFEMLQNMLYVTLSIPPISTPLNVSCGDGTTFSKTITVIWIKGIVYYGFRPHQLTVTYILVDPPRFNCTLSTVGSVVSWSQCVNFQDYTDHYVYNITDNTATGNYINYITMATSIDFKSYPCGTTYQFSVHPVNVVGEGIGAMVNYTSVCPTSSGGECSCSVFIKASLQFRQLRGPQKHLYEYDLWLVHD